MGSTLLLPCMYMFTIGSGGRKKQAGHGISLFSQGAECRWSQQQPFMPRGPLLDLLPPLLSLERLLSTLWCVMQRFIVFGPCKNDKVLPNSNQVKYIKVFPNSNQVKYIYQTS